MSTHNKAERSGLDIITHERACEILASRVDTMPKAADNPDRLKRRQANLVALIRQQSAIGARVHFGRQGIERPRSATLDNPLDQEPATDEQAAFDKLVAETAGTLEKLIAAAIVNATETELAVDRAVASELEAVP